jgi:hypothetical protein
MGSESDRALEAAEVVIAGDAITVLLVDSDLRIKRRFIITEV